MQLPALAVQSLTLAWDPSPDPAVAGYNLYYGLTSGSRTNKVSVGNATTATISGLGEGLTYFFVATDYNNSGLESGPSNELSYSIPAGLGNQPPFIITNPLGLTVANSLPASFRVVAGGSAPLVYQWQKDGVDIPDATKATLTLTNLQSRDAGSYRVQISNPAGSISSQAALLTITQPSTLDIRMYAGVVILVIHGTVGQTCRLEYSDGLPPHNWQTLINMVFSSNPSGWIDYQSLSAPKRFYRAVFSP